MSAVNFYNNHGRVELNVFSLTVNVPIDHSQKLPTEESSRCECVISSSVSKLKLVLALPKNKTTVLLLSIFHSIKPLPALIVSL